MPREGAHGLPRGDIPERYGIARASHGQRLAIAVRTRGRRRWRDTR